MAVGRLLYEKGTLGVENFGLGSREGKEKEMGRTRVKRILTDQTDVAAGGGRQPWGDQVESSGREEGNGNQCRKNKKKRKKAPNKTSGEH